MAKLEVPAEEMTVQYDGVSSQPVRRVRTKDILIVAEAKAVWRPQFCFFSLIGLIAVEFGIFRSARRRRTGKKTQEGD